MLARVGEISARVNLFEQEKTLRESERRERTGSQVHRTST